MHTMAKYTMTLDGLNKLKAEYELLTGTRRKEVAEKLKEARSHGDLSENAEYDAAKDEQAEMEGRISELEEMFDNVELIDESNNYSGKIQLGSRFKVYDSDMDEEDIYQIVGSKEANPMENRISDESPVGKALLGHAPGDVIEIEAPGGVVSYTVKEILQ